LNLQEIKDALAGFIYIGKNIKNLWIAVLNNKLSIKIFLKKNQSKKQIFLQPSAFYITDGKSINSLYNTINQQWRYTNKSELNQLNALKYFII
jgi:hypothetical protein